MRLLIFSVLILPVVCAKADSELILLNTLWKQKIYTFAKEHLQHSAWGFTHSQRDYLVSLELAKSENLSVDEEVLFAAAFLHDMGGLSPYEKQGVDHAVRSAELAGPLLIEGGFPSEKIERVKGTILAHTYYNSVPPATPEETVFRDADVLDFMGAIGIARIFSVVERESFLPNLAAGMKVLISFEKLMPEKLLTQEAKRRGTGRLKEMWPFLSALAVEGYDGRVL